MSCPVYFAPSFRGRWQHNVHNVTEQVQPSAELVQPSAELVQWSAELVQLSAELVQPSAELVQLSAELVQRAPSWSSWVLALDVQYNDCFTYM